jgi:hypothetical protein
LNSFLIHVVKDSKNYYNHKENPKVLEAQNKVIELLGEELAGKKVSKEQWDTANAAAYAANAAAYAAYAANAAAYAAHAANAAANAAAYAANAAAHAANAAANAAAANAAKQKEYKHYLIELILKENNINEITYSLLYKEQLK